MSASCAWAWKAASLAGSAALSASRWLSTSGASLSRGGMQTPPSRPGSLPRARRAAWSLAGSTPTSARSNEPAAGKGKSWHVAGETPLKAALRPVAAMPAESEGTESAASIPSSTALPSSAGFACAAILVSRSIASGRIAVMIGKLASAAAVNASSSTLACAAGPPVSNSAEHHSAHRAAFPPSWGRRLVGCGSACSCSAAARVLSKRMRMLHSAITREENAGRRGQVIINS